MLAIPKPRNIPFGELASLDSHKLNQTLASDSLASPMEQPRCPHGAYARVELAKPSLSVC